MRSRRAISQIVGMMIALAIVVTVGSVIFFQGVGYLDNFNNILSNLGNENNKSHLEFLTIEHVRFEPTTSNVSLWLRNTGNAEITIDAVTIVKIDTQELILSNTNISKIIMIGDMQSIVETTTLTQGTGVFNDKLYSTSKYRISVTTTRGNIFDIIAVPFNT